MIISNKLSKMLSGNSQIRQMFEEGNKLKKQYGEDKVYDFSLGNPNAKIPFELKQAMLDIISEDREEAHVYMSNAGFEEVRESIAQAVNKRFNSSYNYNNFIMTVGAASALNIVLKSILNEGDEVICFAPYFLEYKTYVENYNGKLISIDTSKTDFLPEQKTLEAAISKKTKAVIINSPNNPTGVIYSKAVLKEINQCIKECAQKYDIDIITISDEPYRELVYVEKEVPWVPEFIENSVVVYSYSKSLSLAGERIGWLLIPDECVCSKELIGACTISNRALGCVNAPSLMQRLIAACPNAKVDVSFYDKNRKVLYNGLKKLGFEMLYPEGGFYIFLKTPVEERLFIEKCKEHRILLVSGTAFDCSGYVRIAYCVSEQTVLNSLESFRLVAKECGLLQTEANISID